jgi:hypothetical protein
VAVVEPAVIVISFSDYLCFPIVLGVGCNRTKYLEKQKSLDGLTSGWAQLIFKT